LLFILAFLQSAFLSPLFKPGFISPDLVLAFLFAYSFLEKEDIIFKALFGGFVLDILHDTLGLFMSTSVVSAYLMFLFYEKILIKRLSFLAVSFLCFVFINYLLKLLLMGYKFSFELNIPLLLLSLILTSSAGILIYNLVFGRHEQA
jgi:rod shape-determining protein MreD